MSKRRSASRDLRRAVLDGHFGPNSLTAVYIKNACSSETPSHSIAS
jgi:hypothetical protein